MSNANLWSCKSKYYRHGTDVYMDIYEDSDGNEVIDYNVEGKIRSQTELVCSCVNIVLSNFIVERLTGE